MCSAAKGSLAARGDGGTPHRRKDYLNFPFKYSIQVQCEKVKFLKSHAGVRSVYYLNTNKHPAVLYCQVLIRC